MEFHHSEFTTDLSYRPSLSTRILRLTLLFVLFSSISLVCGGIAIWRATMPPVQFPAGDTITIEEGKSLEEIGADLKAQNIIKSETAFYFVMLLWHDPTRVKASTYKFNEPISVFGVADRLSAGEFGIGLIRFVHFEGERNEQLAMRAAEVLDDFNVDEFLELTKDKEGRMFPDTYLIPETYTAYELMTLLESTFESKIEPLRPTISESNYTESEVIIIASLIEREADTRDNKRKVAGVIENRIAAGMPLQLDASIEYIMEGSYTSEDLAAALRTEDSPYNTYINPGLPPTPIGNPGLTSIEAVLRPLESNYLFYLTGRDGTFYFASTLDEHNRNVAAYLK